VSVGGVLVSVGGVCVGACLCCIMFSCWRVSVTVYFVCYVVIYFTYFLFGWVGALLVCWGLCLWCLPWL